MSDSLDGSTISGALQNRGEMRRWMRAVNRNLLLHRNVLDAGLQFDDDPSLQTTVKAPPPPVDFTVIGTDGQFQITITLPQDAQPLSVTLLQQSVLNSGNGNPLGTPMVHELQSATTTLFDAAGGVVTYGPFSELTQTYQLPNQTLFWRIRSSFDGSNWNAWQIYSNPLTCGPAAVSSGFLRSTSGAPNMPTNSTNNATVDSIDAGSSATIRAYGPGGVGSSWIRYDGQGGQTSVPAGTVLGASYTTAYIVEFNPVTSSYQAFPRATQYVNSLLDPLYFAGVVTTVAQGGSGGSGGGGGGSGGGSGHTGGGCPLSGAPVRLFGKPEAWQKRVLPCEQFVLLITETGRMGVFSRKDRRYCDRGLVAVEEWKPGFYALTEDGEELVTAVYLLNLPGGTVDSYEATTGHVYSAWGFIGHNFKPYL